MKNMSKLFWIVCQFMIISLFFHDIEVLFVNRSRFSFLLFQFWRRSLATWKEFGCRAMKDENINCLIFCSIYAGFYSDWTRVCGLWRWLGDKFLNWFRPFTNSQTETFRNWRSCPREPYPMPLPNTARSWNLQIWFGNMNFSKLNLDTSVSVCFH